MKKKILLTALLAVMVVSMSMFVGCFKGWNDGTRIAFAVRPSETFYEGDTTAKLTFTLKDLNKGEEITFDGKNGTNGITVDNFSVATVGQRTATIKYGNYTLSFTYNVLSKKSAFAGGDGGQYSPFEIATKEQFKKMLQFGVELGYKYYKLTSNLDFSDETLSQPMFYDHGYVKNGQSTYFEAVIDGDKHEVTGLNAITDEKGNPVSKRGELFGFVGRFTLKNITFEFNGTRANCVSGLVTSGAPNKDVLFENVTTKGEIDCNNFANTSTAAFMAQTGRGGAHNVTFKNCTNEVNIKNAVSQKLVAGFTNTQNGSKITFENCTNSGNIQGAMSACAGFVTLNRDGINALKTIKFTNCKNTGEVIKTIADEKATNGFVAISADIKETTESFATPDGCTTIDLDKSVDVMELTIDKDNLTMTLNSVPSGVAYFKAVCQGNIFYIGGKSSGVFTFYQKFDGTALTGEKLLKIAFSTEAAGSSGEYGNAFVSKVDGHLIYNEKTLAERIDMTKTTVAVFAYDVAGNIVGCSNAVVEMNLNYVA